MQEITKENQWCLGMTAHIGVGAKSGLVHTVKVTAVDSNDMTEAAALLHGDETDAFGNAAYQVARKVVEAYCWMVLGSVT